MKQSIKRNLSKINLVMNAWEQLAPEAVFGGFSLAKYKVAMAPALQSESRVAALLAELTGELQTLNINSESCYRIALQMASSVKGDGNYGDDSALYAAMGYKRRSERKSGLTRKKSVAQAKAPVES